MTVYVLILTAFVSGTDLSAGVFFDNVPVIFSTKDACDVAAASLVPAAKFMVNADAKRVRVECREVKVPRNDA